MIKLLVCFMLVLSSPFVYGMTEDAADHKEIPTSEQINKASWSELGRAALYGTVGSLVFAESASAGMNLAVAFLLGGTVASGGGAVCEQALSRIRQNRSSKNSQK